MRHYHSSFGKAAKMLALSAFAAILPTIASAQTYNKQYDGANTERAQSVRFVADESFITAGYVQKPSGSVNLLMKTNSAGIFEWADSVVCVPGNYPANPFDVLYAVRAVPGGGYVFAGTTNMYPNSTAAIDKENVLVMRTNASGGIMWRTMYGGMEKDIAYNIEVLNGGDFIVTGIMDEATTSTGTIKGGKLFLMKLNSSGVLQFCTKVGTTSRDPNVNEYYAGYAVNQMSDGSFVAVGECSNNRYSNLRSMYVVKTSSTGTVSWANLYSDAAILYSMDRAKDVSETTTGNIIVTGTVHDVSTTTAYNKIILMELDLTTAATIWAKHYSVVDQNNNEYNVQGHEMYRTTTGDIVVAGLTNYWNDYTTTTDLAPALIKFDAIGNVLWSKNYPNEGSLPRTTVSMDYIPYRVPGFIIASDPGTAHHVRTDINGNSPCDGNLIVATEAVSYAPLLLQEVTTWCQWEYDYAYPAEFDLSTEYCSDPLKSGSNTAPESDAVGNVLLSPNPVQSGALAGIHIRLDRESKVEVQFTDLVGVELFSSQSTYGIGQYTIDLPTQKLAPGVYIAHIVIDGVHTTQKLVVIH